MAAVANLGSRHCCLRAGTSRLGWAPFTGKEQIPQAIEMEAGEKPIEAHIGKPPLLSLPGRLATVRHILGGIWLG
jgi:hypothetical protein